ncbi:apolipophorins-like [Arctopsyche grandis]|uniref:apolipophorins-like n=1 Tax=Arctopsyche grandis TaxID=121162 RepID=UPI00406D6785
MANNGHIVLLFCVFLLVGSTHADKCSAGCHGTSPPVGGFLLGTAYTYSIEGNAKVQLSGTDRQETSVKLAAEAVVSGLGNCANLLKITNLKITSPDGTVYQKPKNVEKPVRFTLQDGVLGSDICAEQGDTFASLNIKRAILSMLQTANKYNTEVDVFGVCPTSFKVRKDAGAVVVSKYRDLNSCAHREQGKHDLINTIYNPNAEIKSTNVLDSNLRVETFIKNGVVEKSEAIEDYLYMPFSTGSSGAKAQVTTKLQLKDSKHGYNIQASCVQPYTIIFENPHPTNTDYSNINNIQLALKTASQSLGNKVGSKSASIFVGLIRILRTSSKSDIQSVYNQIKGGSSVKDNNLTRRVFLDALFRAGTGDAIEVSIDLLNSKELNILEQRLALISLATVRHATSSSIKATIKLLDVPNLPDTVYLGVGALAGAYCRDHTCHGETSQDENIAALSNKLASKLGNCKANTKKAENSIVYALKGIKNIHHLEDSIVAKLASCASDISVKPRVRVAALETFSADPCIKQLKATALAILKDRQQDSEIRIKAYLALLDCPCARVAGELKTLLNDEPIYQVGAFISSSLRNIRASANPSRAAAKQHFGLIYPKKQYPFDVRRYSQNFEFSYEYDMLGIGSVVDANVIYSQNSFLPRSGNLNLTTELFGRNVNLIELGYRQGNLDRVFEEYFGPQGEINTHTPQEIYKGVKKSTLSIFDKIKQRMQGTRGKRSVLQATNVFGKQLKTDIEGYNGNVDLDIFVKSFGSEVLFLSFGDEKTNSIESLIDRFFDFVDSGVTDAKQFNHEIRNNMLLMDSELAFPTSTGFALKLNSEIASTSRLQFDGIVDLRQIMNDPKNSKIDFTFVPSANVEATGTLMIDAEVISTGLKVTSSLHTSTGTHIIAKLQDNGKGFDIQLGLPVDKQELITADHEIVFVTRVKGHQESLKDIKFDTSNRYQFSGCFDQLASATGLTFCSDIFIPWNPSNDTKTNKKNIDTIARGPLSGPVKFAVRLEKEDLNGFHIVGAYNDKKESEKAFDITLEAKGSKKNRKVSFSVNSINKEEIRSLKLALTSPGKRMEAEATMMNSEVEKSIMAKFTDSEVEYLAKLGVAISGNSAKQIYKPLLQYKLPESAEPVISAEGSIVKSVTGKAVRLTSNNLCLVANGKRISIDGWWQSEGQNGQTDLKFLFDQSKVTVAGKYQSNENSQKSNWEVHNTFNPNLDFKLDIASVFKDGTRVCDIVLVHGPAEKSKINKIVYHSSIKAESMDDLDQIDFHFKNQFNYPLWQIEFKTDTEIKPKKFKTDNSAKYETSSAVFELDLQKDMKTANDFYGKFETKVNEKGMGAELKFEVTGEDKGKFVSKLNLYPGGKHEASGTVNYHMVTDDTNIGCTLKYKHSNKPEEFKFDTALVMNPKLFQTYTKISIGSTDFLDVLLKTTKEPVPSGNLRLILKDFVKSEGQFKVNDQDKKGNGVLLIHFLKANRKIKFDNNFLIFKPQYNVNVDIYYDYEKDNSKKMTFTTINKCHDNTVDSKSSFSYEDQKIDFAIKGDIAFTDGAFFSGKQNFLSTLSHSNGQSISWKLDRQMDCNDDFTIGQIDSQMTYIPNKNSKPFKLNQQGKITTQNKIDFEEHLTFTKPSGEDLHFKAAIQRNEKDKRSLYDHQIELSGALVPHTMTSSGSLDMSDDDNDQIIDMKYRIKSTYGPKCALDGSGKLNFDFRDGVDNVYENEVDATLTLPFEKFQNIKFVLCDKYSEPKEKTHLEGETTLTAHVNADSYKYDVNWLIGDNIGKGKLFIQVPGHDKFLIQTNFKKEDEEGKPLKYNNELSAEYGGNQKFAYTVVGQHQPKESGNVIINLELPSNFKNAKTVKYDMKYKRTGSDFMAADYIVDVDGKKYTLNSIVDMTNPNTPLIEFKGTSPTAKPYRFYVKADALDKNAVNADAKMENIGKFNLDMRINAMLQSADEFRVKVDIDCETLNLKKIQFEAINEGESKGAKKIRFSAKENNKEVLSGSTTYQNRQEGGKFIMEGSGSYKLRDQQKSTSFKYIRDKLSEGNEKGVEVFFNVALGEKSTVIEYKNTNLAYKFSSAYCEEKKQCAHIDINNKLDTSAVDRFMHNLQVSVDLRKLGFVPEFGLQTATDWERTRLPTHTFDVHLNLDKSKYHTQAYAKPVKGNYMTAYTMTLPHRIISLESSTTYSDVDSKKLPFPFQHEIALYLNKNVDPQSKSMLKVNADIQRTPQKYTSANAEIIFSNPILGKNLKIAGKSTYDVPTHGVTGDLVLDIFKKESQKIVVSGKFLPVFAEAEKLVKFDSELKINGKGLGFEAAFVDKVHISTESFIVDTKAMMNLEKQQKEAAFSINLNKHQQKIQMKAPTAQIFTFESNTKCSEESAEFDGTLCFFQQQPIAFNLQARIKPQVSVVMSTSQGNSGKLIVSGVIDPAKRSDFKIEVVEGKKQKNLAHVGFRVENKLLKSDSGINQDNIKQFTTAVNANIQSLLKNVQEVNKNIQEHATKDIQKTMNLLRGASADLPAISNYMQEEFKKISNELESDKSLQQFMKSMNDIIKATLTAISEFMEKATGVMQQTFKFTSETFDNIMIFLNEKVMPELTNFYKKISATCISVLQSVFDLATHYVALLSDFIEKHSAELKPLLDSFNAIFNDLNQMFVTRMQEMNTALNEFYSTIVEQIKNMPILSSLEEKLKELEIPEKVAEIMKGCISTLAPLMPTEELKTCLDQISSYVEKKLAKEECNDVEELKTIFKSCVAAADSLVVFFKSQIGSQDYSVDGFVTPNWWKWFRTTKPGTPSVSAINYLEKERLPTFVDFVKNFRPKSWHPIHLLPPNRLQGSIAGGQHIFTFDGRHMTFPGSCKYVVSQDAVDGNFSIVITLENGKAKAINVVDKSGNDAEVTSKQLLYNGSPYGFPLIKANMLAFRDADTITIKTQYGARVECTFSLDLCYFEVSGFYSGKLRGLLGDGNNEPHDDFRLPNGKISSSESEFGNAYAVIPGCSPVKTVDHSHHHGHEGGHSSPGICNKVFAEDSNFALCYFALDVDNYKQACQHATQGLSEEKAKKEGCLIARAYALACNNIAVPTMLPDECAQCEVGGETYENDFEFDTKLPQKQADIVLAVETTKANEKTYKELVVPLMSQIVNELKKNKVDDVKVYLVGLTPRLPYPVYYDINNNKLQGAKIDFKNEQRSKSWQSPITTENEEVDRLLNNFAVLLQQAEVELGLNAIHLAYARLGRLQLRPKAVKSIIMVHSEPCAEGIFPVAQLIGSTISELALTNQGVVAHLITPLTDLKVDNVKADQVVGFSENHVFVLGDQKRGLSHSNLREGVVADDDACMSHALESFGNVYSSKNFGTCNNKKNYINLMSQTIVDSLVQVTMERECECSVNLLTMRPKLTCEVENRSDKRKASSKK